MNSIYIDMSPELQTQQKESDLFSLETIINIIRRYWFWLLLSALLGSVIAFYVTAKQGYAFQKTARIMLRDDKQKAASSTDMIMAELGLTTGNVNIANESYVVKSTELMNRVVEKLKLNISYWNIRDIRQIDIYNESPISVDFLEIDTQRHIELTFIPQTEDTYSLSYEDTNGSPIYIKGHFNTVVSLPFGNIIVRPTSYFDISCIGNPVIVRRVSTRAATDQVLAQLNITRPDAKETSLLELQITTSNPRKAADILNTLIKEYNDQSMEEKLISSRNAEKFIQDRLITLGGELGIVDKRILDFRKDNELVIDMTTELGTNYTKVQELDKEAFAINTQIKQATTLVKNLSDLKNKQQMLSVSHGINDASIAHQIEQYNEVFLKYQRLVASAGSKNPLVTTLVEGMDSILNSLKRSVDNYKNSLTLQLTELNNKKQEFNKRLVATASHEKTLVPMIREQKVKEELYIMLLGKREENALSLAQAEPGARILEAAFGSNNPVAPKTRLIILAGAGGGVALCLFVFLGICATKSKVITKQDLQGLTTIPVVAEFPPLNKREKKGHTLILHDDRSFMTESFHILRNNLELMVPNKENASMLVLITSTMAGEGKTFTSSNLAASFGKTRKKVLLIDGDLRKGTLTKKLNLRGKPGLSNLLLNNSFNLEDAKSPFVSLEQDAPHVDFLPTGPLPPNPVPLLDQAHLSNLINHWKSIYDRIVIDGAPFGILADTSVLARFTDITLYVIRSNKIDKRFVPSIQKLADEGKLPGVAFTLNDVDFKQARYHYYGYGYSYAYGAKRK